jgi:hypothetical protein
MPYKLAPPRSCAARWTAVILLLQIGGLSSAGHATGAENPEDFKLELTGAAWLIDSSGTIQANGTPVNLVSDLGAEQQQPTFFGRLVVKPGRKHRIVIEGTPFRISGYNTVDRTIVYRGQTFNVNETLRSSADLNYFFAGYQYDILSGSMGHLGLSVGGAYIGTTGSITSIQVGTTASKSETIGLPLAGIEARVFPIPGWKILEIEGGVRGMDVGAYGNYIEASGSGGVNIGHIALLAGYRTVNPDIHASSTSNPAGVNAHLKGPIFSAQWRW